MKIKRQIISMNSSSYPDYWVYILYCSNKSLYTGYTTSLINRYKAHCSGTASKFTRSFHPLYIAAVFPIYGTKSKAMQLEAKIKKLDRKAKIELINNPLLV